MAYEGSLVRNFSESHRGTGNDGNRRVGGDGGGCWDDGEVGLICPALTFPIGFLTSVECRVRDTNICY